MEGLAWKDENGERVKLGCLGEDVLFEEKNSSVEGELSVDVSGKDASYCLFNICPI